MISIRKSVDDLSRLEEIEKREALSKAILDCYSLAIHSSARYSIEVDPVLALELRANLKKLEEKSRAALNAEQLHSLQSSFRGELREYRDKSGVHLQKLRKEVENAAAAMSVFAETVAANGEDHEQQVRKQLSSLKSSALSNELQEIREGIGSAVEAIQSSVEQIQRSNRLVVAQLQDEIKTLHLRFEQERKALFTDRASGAWNRQKIDIHLDNLLRQKQPFWLLLVWIRNYKRIEDQYSRTVLEGGLKALLARFGVIVGDEAVLGRWTEDQFVAVLDLPPGRAIPLCAEAARKLTGGYAIQENGMSQTITLQVTSGVIDRSPGADSSAFLQKLAQLSGAISGA